MPEPTATELESQARMRSEIQPQAEFSPQLRPTEAQERTVVTESMDDKVDVFPPSFPGYAQLLASGITRRSQLQGKTIEELEKIKDIEPMIAQRIFILVSGEASDAEYDREKALVAEAAASVGPYPEVPIVAASEGQLRTDDPARADDVKAGNLAEKNLPPGVAAK